MWWYFELLFWGFIVFAFYSLGKGIDNLLSRLNLIRKEMQLTQAKVDVVNTKLDFFQRKKVKK